MTTHEDHMAYLTPHLAMHADDQLVEGIDRLDLDQMNLAATMAAIDMSVPPGWAIVLFAPGDATRYMVGVAYQDNTSFTADREGPTAKYWVSWDYGPSYGWEGFLLHPDYVASKWGRDGNPTGSTLVLAVYLALLARALHSEGIT